MKKELEDAYPEQECQSIIQILLSHTCGYSRSEIILRKNEELSESQIHFLQRAIKRLKKHEPVQYITGLANFHGYDFLVNPSVLIPRPETEELVQWVIDDHQDTDNMRVLDIGTGSGCIAITLKKKLRGASVVALDISAEALKVAAVNAEKLGIEIDLQHLDILDDNDRPMLPEFDIIVSNPPYVTEEDRQKMLPNVTDHEPSMALFVDEPLQFYSAIIGFTEDHLAEGGILYLETNELYSEEVGRLMEENGFLKVEVRKDMQGKERMVRGARLGAGR
jgi:release factor glutamine methyltransferase